MTPLYTAEATVTGSGRAGGRGQTSDGRLKAEFSMPRELGGPGGEGTNPEQLVSLGYAACFESALHFVAGKHGRKLDNPSVTVRTGIGRGEGGGFQFVFDIEAELPGVDRADAEALVAEAHAVCPYSNAFRDGAPASARLKD
ncbi:MAG: Ohr family peroxiredoxin [Caulobacteraceae bacterium]|nr:Ohr family peroxiredoxin [Caulobacteraceae bacterium]